MKRLGMPAKPLKTVNLKGLGSRGLNTQSDSTSLGPEWLVEANNIVFDIQMYSLRKYPSNNSIQKVKIEK